MKKKQNQTKNTKKAKTTKAENTILIRVRVSKSNHKFFFFSHLNPQIVTNAMQLLPHFQKR